MKCIIYIATKDIERWNDYMWNLRTHEAHLPPTFKTSLHKEKDHHKWVQLLIPMDDLQRIYDRMDEYATMVEKFNTNEIENKI